MKKIFLTILFLTALVLPAQVFADSGNPTPAAVAGAVGVGVPVTDKGQDVREALKAIADQLYNGIVLGGMNIILTESNFWTQRMAYDAATYLTRPEVFQGKNFTDLAKDATDEALGKLVEDASVDFLGINLCNPSDVSAKFSIIFGLASYGRPTQACKFGIFDGQENTAKKSWKEWAARNNPICQGNELDCQKHYLNSVLDFNTSDTGIAIQGQITTGLTRSILRQWSLDEYFATNGILGEKDPVSKLTLTPSPVIAEELKAATKIKQSEDHNLVMAALLASGKYWAAMAGTATKTFFATLYTSWMSRQGGLIEQSPPDLSSEFSLGGGAPAQARTAKVASFLKPDLAIRPLQTYNILQNFLTCTAEGGTLALRPDECVIDSRMFDALTQDPRVTIGQALDNGWLLRDRLLIPPGHRLNGTIACRNNAYCYSNIIKLRKARALPLGFEIAALKSPLSKPWTLGEVIDAFYNDYDPATGTCQGHDGCKLIDPNWLLGVPESYCGAQGSGALLAKAGTNLRQEDVCGDVKSCLESDGKGCVAGYGYCIKEKNTWKVPGAACPQQYATCQSYTKIENGNPTTKASYLARTIEQGLCTEKNAGCKEYANFWDSNASNGAGNWVSNSSSGLNQRVFLNNNADTCDASSVGCTQLLYSQDGLSTSTVRLKVAPSSLGCYTNNRNSIAYGAWPVTPAEITALNPSPKCSQYASVCTPSEVGCSMFKPTSVDAPAVPAALRAGDSCPQECVGYDTYTMTPTPYDNPVDNKSYFIATSGATGAAQACSASAVGCDQYVNIDSSGGAQEQLNYFTNVRICERPSELVDQEGNQKVPGKRAGVYYSWVGSEREGFELKSYNIVETNNWDIDARMVAGVGVVVDVIRYRASGSNYLPDILGSYEDSVLVDQYNTCNADAYHAQLNTLDPDCRELFDTSGNKHYRILGQTIFVDTACIPFRKTEFQTENLVNYGNSGSRYALEWDAAGVSCGAEGGKFNPNDSSCHVCLGGGKLGANGSCVYWTIPSQNGSCRATENGCREYAGNFAGNSQVAASADFENQDLNLALNSTPPVVVADLEDDVACEEGGGVWDEATTQCTKCNVEGQTSTLQPTQCKIWNSAFVTISNESTRVGGHSLRIENNRSGSRLPIAGYFPAPTEVGKYEVRFWAKAIGANAANPGTLAFVKSITIDNNGAEVINYGTYTFALTSEWQFFKFGPVDVRERKFSQDMLFYFESPLDAPMFVDNITVSKVQNTVTVIKNSWNTPLTCDANPNDNVPGAELGCQKYVNQTTNENVAVKSFSQLCREEAVGCKKFVDTFNTTQEESVVYNAVCGKKVDITLGGGVVNRIRMDIVITDIASPDYGKCTPVFNVPNTSNADKTCIIPRGEVAGEGTCTVEAPIDGPINISLLQVHVGPSTIIIPADQNIYVTDRSQFQCAPDAVGCTEMGLATYKPATPYQSVYYKNTPDNYAGENGILCQEPVVGCEEYARGTAQGGIAKAYFKDPKVLNKAECDYREKVDIGDGLGAVWNGWFKKGANAACYPAFILPGNFFGLWSTKALDYNGSLGLCTESYSGCTQYIDHADEASQGGKSYYRIVNSDFVDKTKGCTKVSPLGGCALFEDTSSVSHPWHTTSTYATINSAAALTGVEPRGLPAGVSGNDANVILNVERDRSCSEWLGCKSSLTVYDPNAIGPTKTKEVCLEVGICDKYATGIAGTTPVCISSKDADLQSPLSEGVYKNRDTHWYSPEYSGYSYAGSKTVQAGEQKIVPGRWQVPNIVFVNLLDAQGKQYTKPVGVPANKTAARDACRGAAQYSACHVGVNAGGICAQGMCVFSLESAGFAGLPAPGRSPEASWFTNPNNFTQLSCRIYPEVQSPFKSSIVPPDSGWNKIPDEVANGDEAYAKEAGKNLNAKSKVPGFETATYCQYGYDCECKYDKISYDGVPDPLYFGTVVDASSTIELPDGVCVGGYKKMSDNDTVGTKKDNWPCNADADCRDEIERVDPERDPEKLPQRHGECKFQSNVENKLGWQGYCVEEDADTVSRGAGPNEKLCNLWLPLDYAPGSDDIYNQSKEAGLDPDSGKLLYCLQTKSSYMERRDDYGYGSNFAINGPRADFRQVGVIASYGCTDTDDFSDIRSNDPFDYDNLAGCDVQSKGVNLNVTHSVTFHPENARILNISRYAPIFIGAGSYVTLANTPADVSYSLACDYKQNPRCNVGPGSTVLDFDKGVPVFGGCYAGWPHAGRTESTYNSDTNRNESLLTWGGDIGRRRNINYQTDQADTVRFNELKPTKDEIEKIVVVWNWGLVPNTWAQSNDLARQGYWCNKASDNGDYTLSTPFDQEGDAGIPHPYSGAVIIPNKLRVFGGDWTSSQEFGGNPISIPENTHFGTDYVGDFGNLAKGSEFQGISFEEFRTQNEGNSKNLEIEVAKSVGAEGDDINFNGKSEMHERWANGCNVDDHDDETYSQRDPNNRENVDYHSCRDSGKSELLCGQAICYKYYSMPSEGPYNPDNLSDSTPDDPVFGRFSRIPVYNRQWQIISDGLGDAWEVRFRGNYDTRNNDTSNDTSEEFPEMLKCNEVDLLNRDARVGLYRETADVQNDDIQDDTHSIDTYPNFPIANCTQIKFWFEDGDRDGKAELQMDWDAIGGGVGGFDREDDPLSNFRSTRSLFYNHINKFEANGFLVYVYLKDQCLAVAKTNDPTDPINGNGLPWTDRLWKDSNYEVTIGKDVYDNATYDTKYGFNEGKATNIAKAPFGASRSQAIPGNKKWFSVFDTLLADLNGPNYIRDGLRAGLPYSCAFDINPATNRPYKYCDATTGESGISSLSNIVGELRRTPTASYLSGPADQRPQFYNVFKHTVADINDPRGGLIHKGVKNLGNIFNKVLELWVWNKDENKYKPFNTPADIGNNSDILGDITKFFKDAQGTELPRRNFVDDQIKLGLASGSRPPQIASFDPQSCQAGNNRGTPTNVCELKSTGAFLIDGKDGIQDDGIVFGVGKKDITMQFYGFAGKENMPIRSIAIEWTDTKPGGESLKLDGFYKNRKPFCAIADRRPNVCGKDEDVTCDIDKNSNNLNPGCEAVVHNLRDADGDGWEDFSREFSIGSCIAPAKPSFGNQENACETNYFSFSHSFTFSPDCPYLKTIVAGTNDARTLSQFGMAPGQRYCEFRPRVAITDNWGACNGRCNLNSVNYSGSLSNPTNSEVWKKTGCYNAIGGIMKNPITDCRLDTNEDLNANGVRDAGEPDLNNNNALDNAIDIDLAGTYFYGKVIVAEDLGN